MILEVNKNHLKHLHFSLTVFNKNYTLQNRHSKYNSFSSSRRKSVLNKLYLLYSRRAKVYNIKIQTTILVLVALLSNLNGYEGSVIEI